MSYPSLYLTAALYQFVDLPDYVELQAPLQACCDAHDVKGTLLLAHEGINGTIAGPEAGVQAVLASHLQVVGQHGRTGLGSHGKARLWAAAGAPRGSNWLPTVIKARS